VIGISRKNNIISWLTIKHHSQLTSGVDMTLEIFPQDKYKNKLDLKNQRCTCLHYYG
jgi:hypothetical protein